MKRTPAFRLVTSALIAAAVGVLTWSGISAGIFQNAQLRLTDGLFPAVAADPRIVVVAADERSLDAIGRWPWDRSVHARLIDALRKGGAALIGYDVTFSEPSDPAQDADLARAIGEAGNVVLAGNASFDQRLGDVPRAATLEVPIPELAAAAAAVAHANVIPDPDGIVRALPPVIETPDRQFLSGLSFALFQLDQGLEGPPILRPDGVQVGSALIPTGRGHLLEVNYAEGFPVYSVSDVIDGTLPVHAFRGKIVLVGATALGLGDLRLTPLDKSTGQPGVMVHANALNTMVSGRFLFPAARGATVAWAAVVALLVALIVAFVRVWLSPIAALAIGAAYFMVAFRRFDEGNVMNLVYPALAVLVAYIAALSVRYFTEERERRRVTRVFGRYVAKDVVEEVLSAPERALATLEGASRPLSVLFADLRGFTAASEGAEPTEVVKALNAYLDAMVRAVNEERGTIDKFMGDCVMAFWGAPRAEPQHAQRAVRAAMRMLDYIERAVARGETAGLQVQGCGVGISTGEAVVGNIGSTERLDYTVIGDTVNTASRICGVAGPGQVVVTERTANLLDGDLRLAPLPPLHVKGKTERLKVFQVLREGQEPPRFAEGATLEATEEKGHFDQQLAPDKAAGYAPIEPVTSAKRRKR
ncbi:MAG TPA: adenylate/guanylate cyclase domain-containing protein [Actinomycetota bacterium]|nr:adenylate/guanylate cyclase domain-containing protein [Actinomycetota bacterium]